MTHTATHTPGPWFLNGPWHIQAHSIRGDVRPRIIAQMVNKYEPDAHLIAAAPAMYEALEQVWEVLGKQMDLVTSAMVEEAIAQAEGKP